MPTYTYECKSCGNTQDVFHAMSAKPRVKCTECGGACKRLLGTGAGIIFKGSGFYETDYKKNGGRTTGSSSESKKEGKAADSSSGSKGESKAESKTESKSSSKSKSTAD